MSKWNRKKDGELIHLGVPGRRTKVPSISSELEHFRFVTREHKLVGEQIPNEVASRRMYLEALTEPFIKDVVLRSAVAEIDSGNFRQQAEKVRGRALELAWGNEARARAILRNIYDHAMEIKKVKLENEISFPVRQAFGLVTGLIGYALLGEWG